MDLQSLAIGSSVVMLGAQSFRPEDMMYVCSSLTTNQSAAIRIEAVRRFD